MSALINIVSRICVVAVASLNAEAMQAYPASFEDVAAAKESALARIRRGAAAASFGVPQAARESPGVLAIGANRDRNGVASDGIRDGLVNLGVYPALASRVPRALRTRLAPARDSIVAGTLRVPMVEFVPDSIPVVRR